MIATLDVCHLGKSYVVAFRAEEDARRFIAFVEAHAREVRTAEPEAVYRLDPQWSLGQYNHRPRYAAWGLEKRGILRMILELVEARVGSYRQLAEQPRLDMRPSETEGTTFSVTRLPPTRLN